VDTFSHKELIHTTQKGSLSSTHLPKVHYKASSFYPTKEK